MKVYLVKASAESDFKDYKKSMMGPPQNIFAAAAATPKSVDIEMCDETISMSINWKTDADIVAIFMSTPDAPRAYSIGKKFKDLGKTVVFGGLHSTFMPDEALNYGDSVLIGEIEGIWENLLEDFENNKLEKKYKRETPVDLSELKPYPTNIISPSNYENTWSVVMGRGCKYACTYCLVHKFFKGYRLRPIDELIKEIKNLKELGIEYIELHADNFSVDREYAVELFTKLIPLNIKWFGEATIDLAEDEELLKLASQSGLTDMLVGMESPDSAALKSVGKGFLKVDKLKDYVKKIQSYGIKIDAGFLFGFETHDLSIFKKSWEFLKDVGVDHAHSVIVCPFPGSTLYNKLKKEGRILTKNWAEYDCSKAVFKPKLLSTEDLERGAKWFAHMHEGDTLYKDEYIENAKVSENIIEIKKENFIKAKKEINTSNTVNKDIQIDLDINKGGGKKVNLIDDIKNALFVKWRITLALFIIILAVLLNQLWILGILFLIWAINDLKSGRTFLMDSVSEDENFLLFTLVVITWMILALLSLSDLLYILF